MPVYRDPRLGRLPDTPPDKRPVIRPATTSERLGDLFEDYVKTPVLDPLMKLMGVDTPEGQIQAMLDLQTMGPVAPAMAVGRRAARGAVGALERRAQQGLPLEIGERAPAIIASRGDKPLNVAVAMEQFGHTRDAFRNLGHNAVSIDLMPDRMGSPHHIQDDVFKVLESGGVCNDPLDMVLGHPSCTYLAGSGLHWNSRIPGRAELTDQAAADFMRLYNTPAAQHVAVENPVGAMSSRFRPADQYIQPFQFGSDASKKTGLWLRGLPPLEIDPAMRVPGRMVTDPNTGITREIWGNQTPTGQNKLGPSADRAMQRAQTYPGIAEAMAKQWSEYLLRLRGR